MCDPYGPLTVNVKPHTLFRGHLVPHISPVQTFRYPAGERRAHRAPEKSTVTLIIMDPSAPDFESLASQLNDDAVAFGTDNPVNAALQEDLLGALSDLEGRTNGSAGMAVLETTGQPAGQLRDLAQDLKDATGLDTVIVRTPASTAAVSGSLTRAQVEQGQYALISEPDYAAGVRAFGEEAAELSVPWLAVICAVVIVAAVAVVVTLRAARTGRR